MQRIARFSAVTLAAAASLAPVGVVQANGVPAVQKVVEMLQDMTATAKKEKQAEEVSFSAFATWCTNEQANLHASVKRGAKEIESLSAEIGKLASDSKVLGEEIGGLHQDVGKFEADLKSAQVQRDTEHKAFKADQLDHAESIDALERAIATLQKQNYDRTALLQLKESSQLPANAQQMVSAFLGMMDDEDPLSYSNPEANAYEFQSGGVVDMLKRLRAQFVEKKGDLEKEEMNSQHAHEMLAQDLTSSHETATEDISTKSLKKSSKDEKAASLKKQLSSTQSVQVEDIKSLQDAKIECSEKKESYEEKQQLRSEEIEALEKAIEILSSDDVQASASKHLALAATRKATALVQASGSGALRGASAADSAGVRGQVRDFLQQEGDRLKNKDLGLLAQKISADPFIKVRKLIEDLITRLLEESHADAEHKGFCDKELGESKITRTKLSETVDGLTADIEGGKASITQLTQDIAMLSQDIADLDVSVQQATELRTSEKEKNLATIKDAQDAQKAVQAAMAVLKDFYAKASTATALVQTQTAMPTTDWGKSGGAKMGSEEWNALGNPNFEGKVDLGHKEGMQTFGDTYQGKQDEAGGVLAMLEVILSDFATLKGDTESAEALNQHTYDEFMAESKKDRAVKSRKVELNNADKASAEAKLRDDIADLKFTQDKLLAADRYFEKLKPQCLDNGMTFDQRTKARQEEIQSLKEALRILEGSDIA